MKKLISSALVLSVSALFATEPFQLVAGFPNPKDIKQTTRSFSGSGKNFDGKPNICVKWNLSQMVFKNISLMAEYGFHKNLSVGLGVSNLLERALPSALYQETALFDTPRYKGWAITPELRWYPSKDEDKTAPNGFYIALYGRYAKYSVSQNASYTVVDNGKDKTYSAVGTSTYKGFTGGLMIGRQWVFDSGFTFDWWIVGGGYGKASYNYEWYSQEANLTTAQQSDLKTIYQDFFGNVVLPGGSSVVVTTTPKSANATVSGIPMISLRSMGFCFGYSF